MNAQSQYSPCRILTQSHLNHLFLLTLLSVVLCLSISDSVFAQQDAPFGKKLQEKARAPIEETLSPKSDNNTISLTEENTPTEKASNPNSFALTIPEHEQESPELIQTQDEVQMVLPTATELEKVKSLVEEIMVPDQKDFDAKKITAQEFGEKYLSYIEDAESVAAKYYLLVCAIRVFSENNLTEAALNTIEKGNELFKNFNSERMLMNLLGCVTKKITKNNAEDKMSVICNIYEKMIEIRAYGGCEDVEKIVRKYNLVLRKTESFETFTTMKESVAEVMKSNQEIVKIQKQLQDAPADPALNLRYAELLITVRGDWDKAYVSFIKSGNEKLAKYAKIELDNGVNDENAKEIADFYWDFAESVKNAPLARAYKAHAVNYYELVLDNQSGLRKTLLERRIKEFNDEIERVGALAAIVTPKESGKKFDMHKDAWKDLVSTCKYNANNSIVGPGKIVAECEVGAGAWKYAGGVLLPNGNVVLIPFYALNLKVYNPKKNIIEKECPATGFFGGVLLPNGNVFLIPCKSSDFAIYDPKKNEIVKRIPCNYGKDAFRGGILLSDGRIVCVPYTSNAAVIVSPKNCEIKRISSENYPDKYEGGVLCPDDVCICVPSCSPKISVVKKDKILCEVEHSEASWRYCGGCVLPTQNSVAFVTHRSRNVAITDLITYKIVKKSSAVSSSAFCLCKGGVLLPNENVLLVPRTASQIQIYNPQNNAVINGVSHNCGDNAFNGGILLPNGDVVLIPAFASKILVYRPEYKEPKKLKMFKKETCESPYLNKY